MIEVFEMDWVRISDDSNPHIYRTRVPWGWLVLAVDDVPRSFPDGRLIEYGYEWRNHLTFVFDPFHMWKVDK